MKITNDTDFALTDEQREALALHPNTNACRAATAELHEAGVKLCRTCGTIKAHEEFSAHKAKRDSLQARCRPCAAERTRSERTRRKAAGLCREFGCSNPLAEGRGDRCTEHADGRLESAREQARLYYAENAEAQREYARRYGQDRYASDPDYRAAAYVRSATRRAIRLKALPVTAYRGDTLSAKAALRRRHHVAIDSGSKAWISYVTPEFREELDRLEEERRMASEFMGCPMHLDHIIPLQPTSGPRGLHTPANLSILPGSDEHPLGNLNLSKGNRPAEELAERDPEYRRWMDDEPTYGRVTVARRRIRRGVWVDEDPDPAGLLHTRST